MRLRREVGLLISSETQDPFGGEEIVYVQKTLSVIAWLVAWAWALIAGVGGFVLLVHQGPLPITNGWFAMFSGIAACPLTATLLKRYARVVVPGYLQFAIALGIFIAGRVAVVFLLHRPFLPTKLMAGAIAAATFTLCLALSQSHAGPASSGAHPM